MERQGDNFHVFSGKQKAQREHAKPDKPPWNYRDHLESMATLENMTFPPLKQIVPTVFYEGCTLFCGKPKTGKTFATIEAAVAITLGRYCFGDLRPEPGGAVLWLALEDTDGGSIGAATS